jgi:hypothetical protein
MSADVHRHYLSLPTIRYTVVIVQEGHFRYVEVRHKGVVTPQTTQAMLAWLRDILASNAPRRATRM